MASGHQEPRTRQGPRLDCCLRRTRKERTMTTVLEQVNPQAIADLAPRPASAEGAAEVPALLVEHLTKRFLVGRKKTAVVAVDDVSLRIRRGEIYGILGANGSGKSTLIRLVSTLLTLDTGRVEVFGHDIQREEMAVKRVIN